MKRFLAILLILTCMLTIFCPAFAAEACKLPQDLPGTIENVAVFDVLVLGGEDGDTTSPQEPVVDIPADGIYEQQPVDGKYSTMGALFQAWGGYEGYPDYVCGVWSTDGGMSSLTVAVTKDEAGERGKEEILSQLKNPDSVTFTTQKYRYSELQAVMDEITAQMGGDNPIVACGIYEMENKVHISVLETAENAETVAQELLAQYGDKVTVELGSMILTDTLAEYQRDGGNPGMTLVLTAAVVLMGLAFAFKLPARVTSTGKVVTGSKPTRTQVENAVCESTETPPDRVEDAIRKQL